MPIILGAGSSSLPPKPPGTRELARMERRGWAFASPNVPAIFPLWDRLTDAARSNRPISLAEWVKGASFVIGDQRAFTIDTLTWPDDTRAIAEDFLTFMCARSYYEHRVLIGAYVIDPRRNRPPKSLFDWAAATGVYSTASHGDEVAFHIKAMAAAQRAYSTSR